MKLINKFTIGDHICSIHLESLGYTFKIKTRINGKLTEVGRSYAYFNTLEMCNEKLNEQLNVILGTSSLLNIK